MTPETFIIIFATILLSIIYNISTKQSQTRTTTALILIGFVIFVGMWTFGSRIDPIIEYGLKIDPFRSLIISLILLISGIVHHFSIKYMAGDRNRNQYFTNLGVLILSTLGFVVSDHVVMLGLFWTLNQILLSRLMIHKSQWSAACEGGRLFLKYALCGSLFLWAGLAILVIEFDSFSLDQICKHHLQAPNKKLTIPLILIVISTFIQSGIWPFHKWLISSLNSPTPVSAFMHAGLVNGGGILLGMFAPILLGDPLMLQIIAAAGTVSLILGTIWKLIQPNIKKFLACSTISQIGFMLLQCGLGLFPAAISHLCMHGLFKGFLFLSSGSVIQIKSQEKKESSFTHILYAIGGAIIGVFGFLKVANLELHSDTQWALLIFVGMSSSHILLGAIRHDRRGGTLIGMAGGYLYSVIYGLTLSAMESLLEPIGIYQPQQLNIFHVICISLILIAFICANFIPEKSRNRNIWKILYVNMLNSSQSVANSQTAVRTAYKY